MKKLKCFLLILLTIFMISCKRKEDKNILNKKNEVSLINNSKKDTTRKIYIGKVFFSGDELNDFTVIENNNFKKTDSLGYSIYKKNDDNIYLFCLERFVENIDIEKYKIIDTIHLKNYNSKNFVVKEIILKNKVNLIIYFNDKVIKKWEFKQSKKVDSPIAIMWYGIYKVKFEDKNIDWTEKVNITLEVKKDSIIYEAAGYQLFQKYILNGKQQNKILKLEYVDAIDNSESAVLKTTKDFGQISFDGKNYLLNCPYVDISFMNGKKIIYILNKK